jgi:O-antigen/teichoic acid export membrane protein
MSNGSAGAGGGGGRERGKGAQDRLAPGGTGAVLGMRMIRLSGVQGTSLVLTSLMQMAMLVLVAQFLGPSELGRYSLLLFLGALITHALYIPTKPGTISRTFGGGDEEDDDDDEDETSSNPKRSLGVGLVLAGVLGLIAAAVIILFRDWIAEVLLGTSKDGDLVLWAGILGATGAVFRLASITLWFEQRPSAYVAAEIARPLLGIAILTPLVAAGLGVEGAIVGVTAGTAAAAAFAVVMLRGSFEPALNLDEVAAITRKGATRAPIMLSLFTIQQGDVFLLSRFVDHADVGLYTLASRLGLAVSFAPQGFRLAMRPLRKTALMPAAKEQYGKQVFQGQLLGYFLLLCIGAILVMVLAAEPLIQLAPSEYADAAPLIPLSAAAMIMPPLYRTVNGTVTWPNKGRGSFIIGTVTAALAFIGLTVLLAPELGIYSPPVALLASFGAAAVITFVRGQLSQQRIAFPYVAVATALALAAAIAAAYHLLRPSAVVAELVLAAVAMAVYVGLLFALRVIPESHRPALSHMVRSSVRGHADRFNPRRGLRSLDAGEREALHEVVMTRVPEERFEVAPNGEDGAEGADGATLPAEELVRSLRRAGVRGGMPVRRRSKYDAEIAKFLFSDEPIAVRQATMRRLLDAGEQAGDLRALEDLVARLQKLPADVWNLSRNA